MITYYTSINLTWKKEAFSQTLPLSQNRRQGGCGWELDGGMTPEAIAAKHNFFEICVTVHINFAFHNLFLFA